MEWINSNQGVVMVVLTAIYAFTTIWILFANNMMVKEAKKSREEENRPYVVVFFKYKPNGLIYLVVKNTGKTLANNVKFDFDTPLYYPKSHPLKDSNLIKDGIPTLPPQYEIRAVIEMMHQIEKNEDGKYPRFKVEVNYNSSNEKSKYSDKFILDPNIESMLLMERELGIHDLAKSVEKLVKQFKKI